MAIAGASAGTSIMGQRAQSEAASQVEDQRAQAVEDQQTETRKRATADYLAMIQDIQLQQSQERQALAEQEMDLSRKERSAVSQAVVASSESGVVGQSLEAIKADYRYQQDLIAGRLGLNQKNADYQHTRDIQAAGVTYNNRVTGIQPYQKQPVKPVDYFGPIFGVAQAGLNAGVATGAFGKSENPFLQASAASGK
jgi:hypothetical protein